MYLNILCRLQESHLMITQKELNDLKKIYESLKEQLLYVYCSILSSIYLSIYLPFSLYFRSEQETVKNLTEDKDVLNKEVSSLTECLREKDEKEKEFQQKLKSQKKEIQTQQKQIK